MTPGSLAVWQPLRQLSFRELWIASIISNSGAWIYTVTVQWQVTSMSASPSLVSMVVVAANLPQFIFLLPAGVLSDFIDRRLLLIVSQAALVSLPLLLGAAVWAGHGQVWILIVGTFLIGIAAAFGDTARQAIVPDIVPQEQLVSAVALNSFSINVSRSVGPAIAGVLLTSFGAVAGCFASAVSSLAGCLAAFRLHVGNSVHSLSARQFVAAMGAGLQFVRHTPQARAILIRETTFVFFASVLWALLPALVKHELGMGAAGYGKLMACLGLGALASAFLVPLLQGKFSGNQLAVPATIFVSCSCILPAAFNQRLVLLAALFLGGMGWAAMLVVFNTAMQMLAPGWVRGRALSAQAMMLFGTLAAGSAVWGFLAESIGLNATFLISGFGLLATLVLHCRYALTVSANDRVPDFCA
jgi:MFS family permease